MVYYTLLVTFLTLKKIAKFNLLAKIQTIVYNYVLHLIYILLIGIAFSG